MVTLKPLLLFTNILDCISFPISNDKYCELDPMPTSLVKICISELGPVIAKIINQSLSESVMPSKYKQAIVKPLLKKPKMDTELKNYRPVSNLSFLSKIIEKATGLQVLNHLVNNNIREKLCIQS